MSKRFDLRSYATSHPKLTFLSFRPKRSSLKRLILGGKWYYINAIRGKGLKQKQILIVDDEAINRLIVKKAVGDLAAVADEAKNGQEALEKIANNQYDLIFMDIEMPEMNGYEAAKNIRNLHPKFFSPKIVINYKKVPIIAITSLSEGVAKQRALFFGMNDFVSKPVNKKILLDLLDKWLANK